MSAQLLHGDCLELMKTLPDKSVSLFLCDLPYGCLSSKDMQFERVGDWAGFPSKKGVKGCPWDVKLNLAAFWEQVERLAKDEHTPVIHFCNARFGFELYNSKPDWFRYDLVWKKTCPVGFLQANRMPLRIHENIYVFAKKGAQYHRKDIETRCVTSVIESANPRQKGGRHPTQKPADLYKWLIERYSKEGDTILDPTAGSFTSIFTAKELGRHGIGMEKDDTFFATALARAE